MKQKMVLIISVVVGLLAALLTRGYLNAKDKEVKNRIAEINMQNVRVGVLVFTRDMAAGETIRHKDLGSMDLPQSGIRQDTIKTNSVFSIIGAKLAFSQSKAKPILWSDIEGGEPGHGGLASDVKPRMRAISVNVSGAASVSGMVNPNDRVDVLGTFTFPNAKGESELVTFTILQDVTILATGKQRARSTPMASQSYNMVTLEVTPREAEILVFAEQIKGRLTLALRNPKDTYSEKTLPKVDFDRIQKELETLNTYRQETIRRSGILAP